MSGSIRFRAVTKRFAMADDDGGRVSAVDGLDLDVHPGDALGLIGPNGAGKSTVLRLAAGVLSPTHGIIERRGRTCSVIELGAGVHRDLSGRENIELLGRLFGATATDLAGRHDQIVDFADLRSVLDQPVRTYSSGMVARLAFAVAAHTDPELLLLDEVLSVGDLAFQERCVQRLAELRRAGTTLVMVSHDLRRIQEVCDRVVLLAEGRVREDGPARDVIRRYLGLPASAAGTAELDVSIRGGIVRAGDPVVLDLGTMPHLPGVARLRVELVVRDHPTFEGVGESLAVVFARTAVDLGAEGEDRWVALDSAELPGGSFEVHCTAEDPDGRALGSADLPLTITAPEGPFVIRLAGTGGMQGAGRP